MRPIGVVLTGNGGSPWEIRLQANGEVVAHFRRIPVVEMAVAYEAHEVAAVPIAYFVNRSVAFGAKQAVFAFNYRTVAAANVVAPLRVFEVGLAMLAGVDQLAFARVVLLLLSFHKIKFPRYCMLWRGRFSRHPPRLLVTQRPCAAPSVHP
jgi:hypothetical protein